MGFIEAMGLIASAIGIVDFVANSIACIL